MKLNNNDDSHNSGLNLLIYNMLLDIESHPAWVCGLKPSYIVPNPNCGVTPCVGVWIETVVSLLPMKLIEVTPCVGVWIETSVNETSPSIILSHPAWVCGLKPWNLLNQNTQLPSHPAWVCGLKQL